MHKKAILRWLIAVFCLIPFLQIEVNAQEASAEFITSVAPAKMESGEVVKDGIQSLL